MERIVQVFLIQKAHSGRTFEKQWSICHLCLFLFHKLDQPHIQFGSRIFHVQVDTQGASSFYFNFANCQFVQLTIISYYLPPLISGLRLDSWKLFVWVIPYFYLHCIVHPTCVNRKNNWEAI